ncbi:MAG TPA: hypothetical protein DGR97_09740, partial [Gammaproteobacteria bacterium]|nr:hypothetical protein [Gammaproteobacteria bacterium]
EVGYLGTKVLQPTPIYDRAALDSTFQTVGPAIIEQFESTTVLPSGWSVRVDTLGNLILSKIPLALD